MTDLKDERAALLAELQSLGQMPGGQKVLRHSLNVLAGLATAVPVLGPIVSAGTAVWAEAEQDDVNKLVTAWATATDAEIESVKKVLEALHKTPSPVSFAELLQEVIGADLAKQLLATPNAAIYLMLGSETRAEFEPFVKAGFATLSPTHSQSSMGAGNRVGYHNEELKRPYGMGSGFLLAVRDPASAG